MARRRRSIGTVGDAYVPVPFQEMFQSNLLKEKSYESAESDIQDTETLLGTSGATAGDNAYVQELEESFGTGLRANLEETGGELIGASSFLKKQLGLITKATSIVDANSKAKTAAYAAIDKADLDPHVAQYKKLEADKAFDAAGGSKARVGYGAGLNYTDLNGLEVKKLMMDAAKQISTDVNVEGVYDLLNSSGENIYDIKRRYQRLSEGVESGEVKPESLERFVDSLYPGWDQPDPNINGGKPLFSHEKTKSKYASTIANKLGNLFAGDEKISGYFTESAISANGLSKEPIEMTDKILASQAGKLFNGMLNGVANLTEVPEQVTGKTYPDIATKVDTPEEVVPDISLPAKGLMTEAPVNGVINLMKGETDGSFPSMLQFLDESELPKDVKEYTKSIIELAAGQSKDPEVTRKQLEDEAYGSLNIDPNIKKIFLKEDGSWDTDKMDNLAVLNSLETPRGVRPSDYKKQVRSVIKKLYAEKQGVEAILKENKESFEGNMENTGNQAPSTTSISPTDKAAGEINIAAGSLFANMKQGTEALFYDSEGKAIQDRKDVEDLENISVTGYDTYPIAGDILKGEEFRTVRFKGTSIPKTGKNKIHNYSVKIPESQFQQSIGSKMKSKDEYRGVHSKYLNRIATKVGSRTNLPALERSFANDLQRISINNPDDRLASIDIENVSIETLMTHTINGYEGKVEVNIPHGKGKMFNYILTPYELNATTRLDMGEILEKISSRFEKDIVSTIAP